MTSKLVLSASSLKTYKQCGRKFNFYKILKKTPSHEPFHYGWVGTIVHNATYYAIADYLNGEWKVTGAKPLTRVQQFFEDIWEGKIKFEVSRHLVEDNEISADKPLFKPDSMKDAKYLKKSDNVETQWKLLAQDLIVTGYNLMTKTILPGSSEVILEQKLEFDYEGLMDVIGYVDIMRKSEAGRWSFYDLKTSRSAPKFLNTDIQFYMYRYGLRKQLNLGYMPDGNYVHLRSKKVLAVDTKEAAVFERNEQEIRELMDGINKGNWEPNLYSILCGFCEYRGHCYGDNGEAIISSDETKMEVIEGINESQKSGRIVLDVYQ